MAGSTWSIDVRTEISAGSIPASPSGTNPACRPLALFPRSGDAMEITDLLSPENVIANLRASSKKQALHELARRAAEATGLHERAIFDVLLERERLGTTGVGNGIAIPHGKLPDLKRLYGLFARLDQPIDFD